MSRSTTILVKGTLSLTKAPVWIWVEHIVSMTINAEGGAVITTLDGKQQALKETPDQVLKLISDGMAAAT